LQVHSLKHLHLRLALVTMSLGSEPLLPSSVRDGGGSSTRRSLARGLIAVLVVSLAFSAGVFFGPGLTSLVPTTVHAGATVEATAPASSASKVTHIDEGNAASVNLLQLPAPLRTWADLWKPASGYIEYVGLVLFVLVFIVAGVHHVKEFAGFTDMVASFGLPCPFVMAAGGVFCMLAGAILLLTYQPLLMIAGAKLLFLFLLPSTYLQHFRAWRKDGNMNEFNMMLKNMSMAGACLIIVGCKLPEL